MTDRRLLVAAAALLTASVVAWRKRPVRPPEAPGSWEPASPRDRRR